MKPTSRLQREIRQVKPFDSDAEEAGLGLMRTTDRLERRIARGVEASGITLQQYNVLRILRGSHPEPLATLEIVERMIEEAPGITRLLDRLETKKLVQRKRCDKDRRRVFCAISPAGMSLLAALDGPVAEAVRSSFKTLSRTETRQLIQLLDTLREGLPQTEANYPGEEP